LRKLEGDLKELELSMSHSGNSDEELLTRYGKLQADFEHREGYTYESKIQQVLAGLGFNSQDFHMPVNHLSGGQRTRALLSRLLLAPSDLLIFKNICRRYLAGFS